LSSDLSSALHLEGLKLQFEALLTEYNNLRDDIAKRREMQGQMENIALAGLGVSIPMILAILDRDPNAIGAILLIPIVFFAIAFAQLRHERSLLVRALYIDSELRPKLDELLASISDAEVAVLGSEAFLYRHSWAPRFVLEWFATTSRATLSLAFGIGVTGIHAYLRTAVFVAAWRPYEIWLLVVNALMLSGNLAIAWLIARKRYHYYLRNYCARS
jgi:hypothetical protein